MPAKKTAPAPLRPLHVAIEACDLHVCHLLARLAGHAERHRFLVTLHDDGTLITPANAALLDSSGDLAGLPKSAVLVCRFNHRHCLGWRHESGPWDRAEHPETHVLLTVLDPEAEARRLHALERLADRPFVHIQVSPADGSSVIRVSDRPTRCHPARKKMDSQWPADHAADLLHALPRDLIAP